MIKKYVLDIDSFLFPQEINQFFQRKKISIHYIVNWNLIDGVVKPETIKIDEVYTMCREDVGNSNIKTFWLKNELPEEIHSFLLMFAEKDAQMMNKNFIPLPHEFNN